MIMLALAPSSIAVVSSDHRGATPIPPVATGRSASSLHRSRSKQAFNALRQQTASVEIPIAVDARPRHTSRGFLLWRFAYAGPRCSPRHHHGAGIRKPSHERSFHNDALPELLEPALRDFYEAPGAPRQIPFGSDSRVQIAEAQPPIPTFANGGHLRYDCRYHSGFQVGRALQPRTHYQWKWVTRGSGGALHR